jgi:UDP-N-acetylglucosamine:LPS N-acetylglucosamine transferase
MLLEQVLTPETLVVQVTELIGDPDRLRRMRGAMLEAARPEAAAQILAQLHELVGERA